MNKETEPTLELSAIQICDNEIKDGYITYDKYVFHEPPKTGWDLYITPDFTLNNAKPVNWFNRKMQELILGFKWKRQK